MVFMNVLLPYDMFTVLRCTLQLSYSIGVTFIITIHYKVVPCTMVIGIVGNCKFSIPKLHPFVLVL